MEIGIGHRRGLTLAIIVAVALASACGESVEPVTVSSVEVTSPLGALLDVGASVRLTATARNQAGEPVGGFTFTWSSSAPSVVSTDAAGSIQALDVGSATIRAEGGGVGGSLALRVVDADLPEITGLSSDPFLMALVTAPSAEVRARLEEAVTGCRAGAGQGRLEAIQDCIAAVEAEVSGAGDPTDRVLLAVLTLFLEAIQRLLNL